MRRTWTLGTVALIAWLGFASAGQAQVLIRAPFVRVGVGDGVYVRASVRQPVHSGRLSPAVWPAGDLHAAAGGDPAAGSWAAADPARFGTAARAEAGDQGRRSAETGAAGASADARFLRQNLPGESGYL